MTSDVFRWEWHDVPAKRRRLCAQCGVGISLYSQRWDSYACLHCSEWAESPCSDSFCPYCSERPARPDVTSAAQRVSRDALDLPEAD